jgi:hypothetical protein
MLRSAVISLLAFLSIPYNASGQTCASDPIAVQIFRSGRPGHQSQTLSGQRSICRQFHEADLC